MTSSVSGLQSSPLSASVIAFNASESVMTLLCGPAASCRPDDGLVFVREDSRTLRRDLPAEELVDFIHGVNIVTFARWAMSDRAPSAEQQMKLLWELELGGLRGSP